MYNYNMKLLKFNNYDLISFNLFYEKTIKFSFMSFNYWLKVRLLLDRLIGSTDLNFDS